MISKIGWIKLHRKIVEWEWYQDSNTKSLFLHLLLTANHKDNYWQGIQIKRGQIVTGLHSLSVQLKISVQSLRTSIKKLKSTNEITIESTNKNSIITLNNYNTYNDNNIEDNNQTNKRPTNKQKLIQLNTDYELISKTAKITLLPSFEKLSKINKQVNNQESDITTELLNTYEQLLNEINNQVNKQSTSNQQTTNKQLTTNKNDNNIKNVKNYKNKDKYRDYVYLTIDEFNELQKKFGVQGAQDRIDNLNDYAHQKPKKFKEYNSHYHTILVWERKNDNRQSINRSTQPQQKEASSIGNKYAGKGIVINLD